MATLNPMVTTSPTCRAVCAVLSALTIISLTGCDRGYNVNKSKNKVVWVTWDEGNGRREWPVDGADAKSFEVMKLKRLNGGKQFGKDKNHVYLADSRIDGADPKTFREFGTDWRDDSSVFLWVGEGIKQLPGSDPDSFRHLDKRGWSRDATQIFCGDRGFIPHDIDSFELLDGAWARDRVAHYYGNREVRGADWGRFSIDKKWKAFAQDGYQVYYAGWPIRGAHALSFVATKHNEGHDKKTNFYCYIKDERNFGIEYRGKEQLEVIEQPFVNPNGELRP